MPHLHSHVDGKKAHDGHDRVLYMPYEQQARDARFKPRKVPEYLRTVPQIPVVDVQPPVDNRQLFIMSYVRHACAA